LTVGYAPKHAKPTSLEAARVENRDGAFGIKESRGGRHHTGTTVLRRPASPGRPPVAISIPEGILAGVALHDKHDAPVSAGLIHSLMTLIPLQRQPHARV
jgi:hypothetical protein